MPFRLNFVLAELIYGPLEIERASQSNGLSFQEIRGRLLSACAAARCTPTSLVLVPVITVEGL